ncbi:MAG: hypothetical protein IKU22_06715 [Alistipes sp.]|nr:hypothetical protein [Alistipes sp.]
MAKYISIIFTAIITSFYFFPFEFTFLPGFNTKMIMAGFGLVLLGVQLSKARNSVLSKDIFVLSVFAALVSLMGLISVTYNETPDYTYASYIVSMWVWLSGAYVAVSLMRKVHGYVSVKLICNYLIAICVAQCTIALLIDSYPLVKGFVDSFLGSGGHMGKNESRLYGIGCALDVAGSRFAAILVMIAYITSLKEDKVAMKYIWLYLVAFIYISIAGNMISRTTTMGVILALVYWLAKSGVFRLKLYTDYSYVWKKFALVLLITLPLVIYRYNTSPVFQDDLRFAFEGFFSLAEKGEWDVHSNNMLMNMYVFPDKTKTWIIGDGYFDGPSLIDPYYVGPTMTGFYKWTDVGYLRFIFYFGILGLIAFMLYFIKNAQVCSRKFRTESLLFWLLLLANFILWFKVATDIFLVFALFLCVTTEENDYDLSCCDNLKIE